MSFRLKKQGTFRAGGSGTEIAPDLLSSDSDDLLTTESEDDGQSVNSEQVGDKSAAIGNLNQDNSVIGNSAKFLSSCISHS
jgi:hypothetical protein